MDGHVAVDDVAITSLHTEGIEYAVADLGRVAQFEVVALFFLVSLFVAKEIALKGGHLRLVEEW